MSMPEITADIQRMNVRNVSASVKRPAPALRMPAHILTTPTINMCIADIAKDAMSIEDDVPVTLPPLAILLCLLEDSTTRFDDSVSVESGGSSCATLCNHPCFSSDSG